MPDRSNSDVMTLQQAGKPNLAKPSWTVGPIQNEPPSGPRYRLRGDCFLFNRLRTDGEIVNWPGRPNRLMEPMNEEARAKKVEADTERQLGSATARLGEELNKTHGSPTEASKKIESEIADLEKSLRVLRSGDAKKITALIGEQEPVTVTEEATVEQSSGDSGDRRECPKCGKEVAVNPSSGDLRKHECTPE